MVAGVAPQSRGCLSQYRSPCPGSDGTRAGSFGGFARVFLHLLGSALPWAVPSSRLHCPGILEKGFADMG